MFGSFGAGRFNAMRRDAANAGPATEVTEQEMYNLFIASGLDAKKARFQVNLGKGLQSDVLIGNKLYMLANEKEESSDETAEQI